MQITQLFPLLLISSFITLRSLYQYDCNLPKFAETWLVTWHMICPWKCFVCSLELRIYILLLLDGMFCWWLLSPFGLNYVSSPMFLCWFSLWLIDPLLKVGYQDYQLLLYSLIIIIISLSDMYLPYIFKCYNVGYIYTYDCYVLLLNWPLYHYIMNFFVSCYCFWLAVYFVWYKYRYRWSLLVSTYTEYLLPSLHFEAMCVLDLKAEVNLL